MRRHPRALLPPPHDDIPEIDRLRSQLAALTQHWHGVAPPPPSLAATVDAWHTVTEALTPSQQAVREAQQRYQELFDGAPVACLVTDLAGTIREANQRASTVLYVPPPRPLSAFLAADRAAFHARLGQLQAGQPVDDWEVSVRPWHHAPFPALLSGTPARTPQGQLIGLRWWLRDLTPLKRAEEALRQVHATLDTQGREHTAAVAVLRRETHHRLKNNFQVIASLLDLHADASADPRVRAALEECHHRLTAMALIHEGLSQSQDPARMDAASYLRTLATRLFEAYHMEGQPVSLALHLEAVRMPSETAVPCGLIVHELVSNALKHAFPSGRSGEVAMTLHTEADGRVSLAVRDTGVGVPDGIDIDQPRSFGWQLVRLLTAQLGGP